MKLILQEKTLNLKTGCNGLTFLVILKRQTGCIRLKWRARMVENIFRKLKSPQDLTKEKKKPFIRDVTGFICITVQLKKS